MIRIITIVSLTFFSFFACDSNKDEKNSKITSTTVTPALNDEDLDTKDKVITNADRENEPQTNEVVSENVSSESEKMIQCKEGTTAVIYKNKNLIPQAAECFDDTPGTLETSQTCCVPDSCLNSHLALKSDNYLISSECRKEAR